MPSPKKTITIDSTHYLEILGKLDENAKTLKDIQVELAARKHYDGLVIEHEEAMKGNGKPGFYQIRDKVQGWDTKINALILTLAGNIIFQVVQVFIVRQ